MMLYNINVTPDFLVIFQLPAAQLENALNRIPALKAPLIEHANQPNIRSTLPRFELVVLQCVKHSFFFT